MSVSTHNFVTVLPKKLVKLLLALHKHIEPHVRKAVRLYNMHMCTHTSLVFTRVNMCNNTIEQ